MVLIGTILLYSLLAYGGREAFDMRAFTSLRGFRGTLRAWLQAAGAAALLTAFAAPALSQGFPPGFPPGGGIPPTGIVGQGTAVVTGFSQATITSAPPGADPYDYYMINPAGPSVQVIDLTNIGPPGGPAPAPKLFTATASQVGQVFGVTLDNAQRPNIYVAATSAYGLEITITDQTGIPHRLHTGQIGATFAQGQFGPPQIGGGPGSIWKIDGTSGAISLFANVPNVGPAALGGLAFDATTQTIFAADRTTGKIYRYGTNGALKGAYDHGLEGRPAAALPPIAAPAGVPINIQSGAFNTENPNTWGFATPARRVFGLAVFNNRLYYSVAQGPQIWSAGIGAGGSVGGKDARLEIELPSLDAGVEISGITFDRQGYMYVAERGAATGDFFLLRLAADNQSRAARYRLKLPADPTPGRWTLTPEQYSIGMAPNFTNADGGIAMGYGYNYAGAIDQNACAETVWVSSSRMLDPGDGTTGFPTIDGIQGTPRSLVQPQNTPPTQSWFIDYDDGSGYADFRGHMGGIATRPCPVQAAQLVPPPPPPSFNCPPGTYFDGQQCIIIPTCPPGTSYSNGQCVYPTCPPGFVLNNQGQCVPPTLTCPPGTFFYQGQCVQLACPPGMNLTPNGQCVCPTNTYFFNGKCVPPAQCPAGSIQLGNGICICPLGLIFGNGVCQPVQIGCPPNQELWNNICVAKCPANQIHTPPNGACAFPPVNCPPSQDYFNGICVNKCPAGQQHSLPDGACKPIPISCPPSQDLFNNLCVNKCQGNQIHTLPNGQCIPPPNCPQTQELWNGICVNKCASPLFEHKLPNGACGPIFVGPIGPIGPLQQLCLGANKELWDGKCVDKCPGNQVHTQPNGDCKPQLINPFPIGPVQILCLGADKEIWENKCVDKCPANQIHKQPNGDCGPAVPQLPPIGPIQVGPLQVSPAALCAIQNKDVYKGNCVDKCPAGQVHKDPDGACGPLVVAPLPVGPQPQQLSPEALCALQNKDFFNNQCLNKCPAGQEHKLPNGACGAINVGPIPPIGPIGPIGPIQIAPSQASCAAQNKDFYAPTMMCVDKCTAGQEHKAPNGACGPINVGPIGPIGPIQLAPSQATCAAQNKDFFANQCVDKCAAGQQHSQPNGACVPIPASAQSCAAQNKDFFANQCVDKCAAGQQHNPPNGACGPIPASVQSCAAQNKDFYQPTMMCVDKCAAGQQHNPPNGACGAIPASVQSCAAQNRDFYPPTMMCVNKCPAGQQHNPPDGACGAIPASAQSCAAQNRDYYEPTMSCVNKCPQGQEHKAPNGACGPINVGPIAPIGPIGPIQVAPSQASCAAQNRDFYQPTMMCVAKCAAGQEHKAPNGACGPIAPAQLQPSPIQVVPSQATCAAQNRDFYDGACVAKCGQGQEHKPPNGACGPIVAAPIQVNPNAIQIVPSQATCAAQNRDFYNGQCVAKCGNGQEHKAPNGACGPIAAGSPGGPNVPAQLQVVPTQAICTAQNKDLFEGKCIDKCPTGQTHQQPDGMCGAAQGAGAAARVVAPTPAQLKVCTDQDKDWYMGNCVDKCTRPNQVHSGADGVCIAAPAGNRNN
jgi:hypothetical protein